MGRNNRNQPNLTDFQTNILDMSEQMITRMTNAQPSPNFANMCQGEASHVVSVNSGGTGNPTVAQPPRVVVPQPQTAMEMTNYAQNVVSQIPTTAADVAVQNYWRGILPNPNDNAEQRTKKSYKISDRLQRGVPNLMMVPLQNSPNSVSRFRELDEQGVREWQARPPRRNYADMCEGEAFHAHSARQAEMAATRLRNEQIRADLIGQIPDFEKHWRESPDSNTYGLGPNDFRNLERVLTLATDDEINRLYAMGGLRASAQPPLPRSASDFRRSELWLLISRHVGINTSQAMLDFTRLTRDGILWDAFLNSIEFEVSTGDTGFGGTIRLGPISGTAMGVENRDTISWNRLDGLELREHRSFEASVKVLNNGIGGSYSRGVTHPIVDWRAPLDDTIEPTTEWMLALYAGNAVLGRKHSDDSNDWIFSLGGGLYVIVGADFAVGFNFTRFRELLYDGLRGS